LKAIIIARTSVAPITKYKLLCEPRETVQ